MGKSNELHREIVKFVMNKFIFDSTENFYDHYLDLQDLNENQLNIPVEIKFTLNSLYNIETLGGLKKAVDNEIEACNVLLNTFTPPVLKGIDYKLLAEQKGELIDNSHINNNKFDGLINLIDNIQDYAVDYMGLSDETVFPIVDNV